MKFHLRRAATLFGAAAVAVTTLTIGAGSASASGNIPNQGELCRASENILFYDINFNPSYTVAAGDAIRIDTARNGSWVWGHGNGHSSRQFIWIHSDGTFRLNSCA